MAATGRSQRFFLRRHGFSSRRARLERRAAIFQPFVSSTSVASRSSKPTWNHTNATSPTSVYSLAATASAKPRRCRIFLFISNRDSRGPSSRRLSARGQRSCHRRRPRRSSRTARDRRDRRSELVSCRGILAAARIDAGKVSERSYRAKPAHLFYRRSGLSIGRWLSCSCWTQGLSSENQGAPG